MKVGVVCEGVTDFHAIDHYVSAAFKKKGLAIEFVQLQPAPDNTTGGGWGNVMAWLENNPPKSREQFFGKGLFAHSKALTGFTSILIHLDIDILPEESFLNFLRLRNIQVLPAATVAERSAEVSRLLFLFAKIDQCSVGLAQKHVTAPIAESSEAWCVAVDPNFNGSAEDLSGQALIDAFGMSFARFNKKDPQNGYAAVNKKSKSRKLYCGATASEVDRLQSCTQFVSLVEKLVSIAAK